MTSTIFGVAHRGGAHHVRPHSVFDSTDPLVRAVAAHLARYKGLTRSHTESDLRIYLRWCAEHRLDPLHAERAHIELYVRWMQEIRGFKPSTISRRLSVVIGFYRTCTIDGIIPASPAEHVRRPNVPPESPTLGLSHLQFEAMLAAAKASTNINDFALVAMLGLCSASGHTSQGVVAGRELAVAA